MTNSIVRAEKRLSKLGVRVLRNRRTGTFQLIDENGGGPVKRCSFDFECSATWIDDLYGWTAADVVELAR